MYIDNKKILILAPHTDDAELGAGGFIAKHISNNEIYCASFSFAKDSIVGKFPDESTEEESLAASKILGLDNENVFCFDYKVRYFSEKRQSILEDLIVLKNKINPDIVLTTSSFDTHQDHAVIYQESFRAFKDRTILGYELPNNNRSFSTDLFVKLSQEHMEIKINSIKIYKSQLYKNPQLVSCVLALAKHRGFQVKESYAEAFEVIRLLI